MHKAKDKIAKNRIFEVGIIGTSFLGSIIEEYAKIDKNIEPEVKEDWEETLLNNSTLSFKCDTKVEADKGHHRRTRAWDG